MKKLSVVLLTFAIFSSRVFSQSEPTNATDFQGAAANLKSYKALFVLDESDKMKIMGVLRNIKNSLDDPRLKGKLEVELVVFGPGVELYKKSYHYDTLLLRLAKRGVIFAECENTMKGMHLSKADLWPFVSYVPSGNGEIIIRESEGWAVVHP